MWILYTVFLSGEFFNLRSRKGNAPFVPGNVKLIAISIHVPSRGTTDFEQLLNYDLIVSIHVPSRGTTITSVPDTFRCTVSIHVPSRGTTVSAIDAVTPDPVSINVPSRGTTSRSNFSYARAEVSIHVPSRGTTTSQRRLLFSLLFQSTFPQGERHIGVTTTQQMIEVSIHVPSRGTTLRNVACSNRRIGFNPRSLKGNDSNSPQIHPSFFSINHQFLLYTPI